MFLHPWLKIFLDIAWRPFLPSTIMHKFQKLWHISTLNIQRTIFPDTISYSNDTPYYPLPTNYKSENRIDLLQRKALGFWYLMHLNSMTKMFSKLLQVPFYQVFSTESPLVGMTDQCRWSLYDPYCKPGVQHVKNSFQKHMNYRLFDTWLTNMAGYQRVLP